MPFLIPSLCLALLNASPAPDVAPTSPAAQAQPAKAQPYFDYHKNEADKTSSLRCRTRLFRHPKSAKEVEIVGMIHIADASFYKAVRQHIEKADLSLMEGVTGFPGPGVIPLLYTLGNTNRVAGQFELHSQGDFIGRDLPRTESADVDINEVMPGFWASTGMFLKLPLDIVAFETANLGMSLGRGGSALVGSTGSYTEWLRQTLSEMPDESDEESRDELSHNILDKRNSHLIEATRKALEKPEVKRICLPWGAAHGAGLETLLLAEGFEPVSEEWLTAIRVDGYGESQERRESRPWHANLPLLFTSRGSTEFNDLSVGPLAILVSHDSKDQESMTLYGWGLLGGAIRKGRDELCYGPLGLIASKRNQESAANSLLWGALHSYERKPQGSDSSQLLNFVESQSHGQEQSFKIGWFGALYQSQQKGEESSRRLLPSLGDFPLLYSSRSDAKGTSHRFLLFFEIHDEK
ncbi:MAG: hypothetical protein RL095_3405 [Verrucomicrobiota bacterium]|jgi:hypothetical protein